MKREPNDLERIYDIDDEQTAEDLDQDQPEAERSAADAGEDTTRRGSAKPAKRATQHTGSKRGTQSTRNELLSVPAAGLRAELKPRSAFTPWLQEGTLAGAGAVLIGVSGVATTTTELATILFTLSLLGLAVLLAADARAKRRWTIR